MSPRKEEVSLGKKGRCAPKKETSHPKEELNP
jgi:hypothetical protein